MDASERKRLIAKKDEQKRIAEAVAEEKRIIASKPIHYMPKDDRLAKLPKAEAIKISNKRREQRARGLSIMEEALEETPEIQKEAEEAPKPKRGRSKRVE